MKISELNLYGYNSSKDPPVFVTFPSSVSLYIERNDFLILTGMKSKRLHLYLLRNKEISTLIQEDKKYSWLKEMLFYLAKLQRSWYWKKKSWPSEKEKREVIKIPSITVLGIFIFSAMLHFTLLLPPQYLFLRQTHLNPHREQRVIL